MKKLRNGQLAGGHLVWSKELEKSIEQETSIRRFKHVFIYRDPRDTFVSQLNYAVYSEKNQITTAYKQNRKYWLKNFRDDDERLSQVIETYPQWDHMSYAPWIHHSHCYAVKFEDLDADCNALEDGQMGETLRSLLDYLEVDAAAIDPAEFFNKDLRKSHNSSSEKSKVGQYKRVFKDQHYAMLDTPAFREILQAYGYEW